MAKISLIPVLALIVLVAMAPRAQGEYVNQTGVTSEDFAVSWTLTPEKDCYDPGDSITLLYTIEPASDEAAKKIDGRAYIFVTTLDNPTLNAVVYYKNGGAVGYSSDGENTLEVKVGEWEDGLEKIVVKVTCETPSIPQAKSYAILWSVVKGAEPGALPTVFVDMCYFAPPEGPRMSVSPKEFETDVYQGSKIKFGIVVEETTDLGPLKSVELVPCVCSCNADVCMYSAYSQKHKSRVKGTEPCVNCYPINPEWISFSKNYFDVPSGGKVTVNCTISIPKDASPGKYIGCILVACSTNSSLISLRLDVLKDTVPPEIVVYSPKNGEVVTKPYITLKGIARDNIGIRSLRINKEEYRIMGLEEKYIELPFEQEMQLEEGWNYFTIEVEDFAGNLAREMVSVKYEVPIETVTPSPMCKSDDDCVWCGRECVRKTPGLICPAISPPENYECVCVDGRCTAIRVVTPVPEPVTPTPTPKIQLEKLSISIYPKETKARAGETVNYTVTVDWYPPEWRGDLQFSVTISAAGFEKSFKIEPSVRPSSNPPITNTIPVPIPENLLPLTYMVKLGVEADSLKASDETTLRISPSTPGFEAVVSVVAGVSALVLRKARIL